MAFATSRLAALTGALLAALLNAGPATAEEPLAELARIEVGAEPLSLALAGDGNVLVATAGARALHLLDPVAMRELRRIDLSGHGRLGRVLVDPDSGAVFLSASIQGRVLKLDPDTLAEQGFVTTGGFPQGMARLGGDLLVALTAGQSVAVIDPSAMALRRSLDAGDRPSSILVARDGTAIYVVKSTTRSIWAYDAQTLEWTRSISDASLVRLSAMGQAPDGRLLLLDAAQDILLVMDPGGRQIEARWPLLPADCTDCSHVPMALALSPDETRVAVVGRGGMVSLLELDSGTLIASRIVGRDLRDVLWADGERIFVASFGSAEVVVLDGSGR